MFDFLPNQPAYQYPDIINVVYVLGWAFFLSSVIAIVHRFTFRGEYYPAQFFQALVLGAIVTAMVMMAVGDSLARGLGVFGAMAIIRFRTRVDDPRNVLFIFAAMSSGLAVGVYGFTVSFAGTVIFCLVALILHYSPFRVFVHGYQLSLSLASDANVKAIEQLMLNYCWEIKQTSVDSAAEGINKYEYSLAIKSNKDEFIRALEKIESVKRARIRPLEFQNLG
jgi:hypothetical protein